MQNQISKISIEDRKNIKRYDMKENTNEPTQGELIKKLILCKGQMFGEDELLNEIYNHGKPKPQISNYTIVCDSFDAEVLFANIEDIHKIIKNEKGILNFINEQFMEKCPD